MLKMRISVSPPRCIARLVCCLLACISLFLFSVAGDQGPLEYEVKAAFLLNFTKFVDWPSGTFRDAQSPVSICILGKDPFGQTIDQIVQGETVNGRKLTVRRIMEVPPHPACQAVYISAGTIDAPHVIASLSHSVLTIGEGDQFTHDGGMIGFVIQNGRVRFIINQSAARTAGLQISSRLLSVAASVQK